MQSEVDFVSAFTLLPLIANVIKEAQDEKAKDTSKELEKPKAIDELISRLRSCQEIVSSLPDVDVPIEDQLQELQRLEHTLQMKRDIIRRYHLQSATIDK